MGKAVYNSFKVISILFLIGLLIAVGAVIIVVVGPILLDIDILAEPTYGRIEIFLKRMLFYIIVFAIGYVIASWCRRLALPKSRGTIPS